MNKNKWILLVVVLIVLVASTVFFFWKNNRPQNNENYEASRTSQSENINSEQNSSSEPPPVAEVPAPSEEENNNVTSVTKGVTTPEPVEELISTFSTKIYSKDEARQHNIYLTCQALTDKIVENGATFSFCNTVGQATTAKGYQKADIFDNKGNKKKGLGRR